MKEITVIKSLFVQSVKNLLDINIQWSNIKPFIQMRRNSNVNCAHIQQNTVHIWQLIDEFMREEFIDVHLMDVNIGLQKELFSKLTFVLTMVINVSNARLVAKVLLRQVSLEDMLKYTLLKNLLLATLITAHM